MRSLIVGNGEVGSSLKKVLEKVYEVSVIDKDEEVKGDFEIMHVCFPFFEGFRGSQKL